MSVLQLADAKAYLNITSTDHDTELQTIIDSAEAVISKRCGPLTPTQVTYRVPGGLSELYLPVTPVISVEKIQSVLGDTLDMSQIYVNTMTGLVSYNYASGYWFYAIQYDITYTIGYETVPDDLMLGITELVRHLWQTQRGGSTRPGSPTSGDPSVPSFLIPYRVMELINPYLQSGMR